MTLDIETAIERLRPDNPEVTDGTLRIVADTCRTYLEARASLETEGLTIVDQKGKPVANPYFRIWEAAIRVLKRYAYVNTQALLGEPDSVGA